MAGVLRRGGGDRAVRGRPAGPPRPRGEARPCRVPGQAADRRILDRLERHRCGDARVRGRGAPPRPRRPRLLRLRGVGPLRGHRRRSGRAHVLRRGLLLPPQVRRRPGSRGRAGHPPPGVSGRPAADRGRRRHRGLRQLRRAGIQPRHRDPGDAGDAPHPADSPGSARGGVEGPSRPCAHRRTGARARGPRRGGARRTPVHRADGRTADSPGACRSSRSTCASAPPGCTRGS